MNFSFDAYYIYITANCSAYNVVQTFFAEFLFFRIGRYLIII